MKFKIALATMELTPINMQEWRQVPGAVFNKYRYQMPGYVLAEAFLEAANPNIRLVHPDTDDGETGHVSLFYHPADTLLDGRPTTFRQANMDLISLEAIDSTEDYLWPTGSESLVEIVHQIECYLNRMSPSLRPRLAKALKSNPRLVYADDSI